MGRGYLINGETLVTVGAGVLGLAEGPVTVRPRFRHLDIKVGNYGEGTPNQQFMLGDATIDLSLVHFDPVVLQACLAASMASAVDGTLPSAGTLMGKDLNGNGSTFYFSVTLSSPVAGIPWVFPTCLMPEAPLMLPLGAERSVAQVTFRAVPYAVDPTSANGIILWHH